MKNSNSLTPILQLRQDDVVAIPLERFQELLEAETRLTILRQIRHSEIVQGNSTYTQAEDYALGSYVLETLWENQDKQAKLEKAREEEAKDE